MRGAERRLYDPSQTSATGWLQCAIHQSLGSTRQVALTGQLLSFVVAVEYSGTRPLTRRPAPGIVRRRAEPHTLGVVMGIQQPAGVGPTRDRLIVPDLRGLVPEEKANVNCAESQLRKVTVAAPTAAVRAVGLTLSNKPPVVSYSVTGIVRDPGT